MYDYDYMYMYVLRMQKEGRSKYRFLLISHLHVHDSSEASMIPYPVAPFHRMHTNSSCSVQDIVRHACMRQCCLVWALQLISWKLLYMQKHI